MTPVSNKYFSLLEENHELQIKYNKLKKKYRELFIIEETDSDSKSNEERESQDPEFLSLRNRALKRSSQTKSHPKQQQTFLESLDSDSEYDEEEEPKKKQKTSPKK